MSQLTVYWKNGETVEETVEKQTKIPTHTQTRVCIYEINKSDNQVLTAMKKNKQLKYTIQSSYETFESLRL